MRILRAFGTVSGSLTVSEISRRADPPSPPRTGSRSPSVQRTYFQCDPAEDAGSWSDERIWAEPRVRVNGNGFELEEGRIIQLGAIPVRSHVIDQITESVSGSTYLAEAYTGRPIAHTNPDSVIAEVITGSANRTPCRHRYPASHSGCPRTLLASRRWWLNPDELRAWAHEYPVLAVEYIADTAHVDPEAAEPLIERLIEDVSSSGEGIPAAAVVLAAVAADPGARGRHYFGRFVETAVRGRAEDLEEWTLSDRAEWTLACRVLSHTGRVEAARVLARVAAEVPRDRVPVLDEYLRSMGDLAVQALAERGKQHVQAGE